MNPSHLLSLVLYATFLVPGTKGKEVSRKERNKIRRWQLCWISLFSALVTKNRQ